MEILAAPQSQSNWQVTMRRFWRHRLAMFSLVVIILLAAMALLAPWVVPYDPIAQPRGSDLGAQYFLPPSSQHWLGTDDLGRDVLSRIIYGSRVSLLVGFVAAISSVLAGTVLGVLAGYFSGRPFRVYQGPRAGGRWNFGRVLGVLVFYAVLFFLAWLTWTLASPNLGNFWSWVGLILGWGLALTGAIWGIAGRFSLDLDTVISRVIDFFLMIPSLPLLLVLSGLLRDPNVAAGQWARAAFGESASVFIIIAVITLFGWTTTARLVRGAVLSLREQDYVVGALALGAGEGRIMFRHLLPGVAAPIIVQATLDVGSAILTEAGLSFLGFGIQPPLATWGNMLTNAQEYIFLAPWLALAPGFMILLTVLAFNFLGDGLRDALDPRARR